MVENRRAKSPYQLIFFHGVEPPAATPEGARLIPLIFSDPSPKAALEALQAADLAAADTKTTAIFVSKGSVPSALVAYAAVVGFVGRFLDVSGGERIEPLSAVLASGRRSARAADARRDLANKLDRIVVSATPEPELPTIVYDPADPLVALTAAAAVAVRFCRQLVLDPPLETHAALRLVAALAGMRSTTRISDRLPMLLVGDDASAQAGSGDLEDLGDSGVVDLEAVRRAGQQLRNQLAMPRPEQIVARKKLSSQQQLLLKARQAEMEPVILGLGSVSSPDGEFFRCPRPQNHANGDANPSMRVKDGKVRCFVCDPEWVDPLQLVLSSRVLAPLEAARWILSLEPEPAAEAAAAA